MMLDAYQPEGVTTLAVDSIFMMPQLGVLASVMPDAAMEVFRRDCLISLGTVVAPLGKAREGEVLLEWEIGEERGELRGGELARIALAAEHSVDASLQPRRGLDVGEGNGRRWTGRITGGAVGVILDGRGRPLQLPADDQTRVTRLADWLRAAGAMPGVD